MSEYEFWDELGNIFNAIVAYQQKTIEFNKRFVNPWLRLGPVLDQNDNIAESMKTHKKAIEIDPDNGSNWLALGDVYFKMDSWDDAADAYGKAIELNPNLGWAYANLALTNANRQKYTDAINLYIRSLEHITDEKDRAMIWNRLGNAYRKVNDYDNASIAFKLADECDGENTGFEDTLDEVTVEQRVMPIIAEVYVNDRASTRVEETPAVAEVSDTQVEAVTESEKVETGEVESVTAPEEPVSESVVAEESVAEEQAVETIAAASDASVAVEATEATEESEASAEEDVTVENPVAEVEATENSDGELDELQALIDVVVQEQVTRALAAEENAQSIETAEANAAVKEVVVEDNAAVESGAVESEKVEEVVAESQTESVAEVVSEETQVETAAVEEVVAESQTESVAEAVSEETQVEAVEETQPVEESIAQVEVSADDSADVTTTPVMIHHVATFADPTATGLPEEELAEFIERVTEGVDVAAAESVSESQEQVEVKVEASEEAEPVAESVVESQPESKSESESVLELLNTLIDAANESDAGENNEPAYEEFLHDAVEPALTAANESDAEAQAQTVETPKIKVGLKVEPDSKNAHVWNELGNIYFNTGSYEDAVMAYTKAIEIDDWFAWPYSNLALVYVQKEKYAEAILLYQRSIELFVSDKDKAVTWNRLGNVYRRLNDYDNAIACYQRADELDPNNATRSLRSRFSLLGSLSVEPTPSLAV